MTDMHCRHRAVVGFATIFLIIGFLMLTGGILTLVWNSWASHYRIPGICGGIWTLIAGILGIIGGCVVNRRIEIVFMIYSIITATVVWVAVGITSGVSGILDSWYTKKKQFDNWGSSQKMDCMNWTLSHASSYVGEGTPWDETDVYLCPNWAAAYTNFSIAGIAILLFVMAIFAAAYACCAVCRCCGAQPEGVYPTKAEVMIVQAPPHGYNPNPAFASSYNQGQPQMVPVYGAQQGMMIPQQQPMMIMTQTHGYA